MPLGNSIFGREGGKEDTSLLDEIYDILSVVYLFGKYLSRFATILICYSRASNLVLAHLHVACLLVLLVQYS